MATILVVDDNATNRALLSRVLQRDGHRVVEAANGAEALGLVWVERPDLVLTDILMPRVDGYALDRELRDWEHTAGVPLIFHTAMYTSDEIREVVGAHGHRRVMPKPADIETISATVASMLDGTGPERRGGLAATDGDRQEHVDVLNAKLLQKVRELELAARERQQLLGSIIRAQEEERERIANDIHDDPVQAMTAVAMRLELMGPPDDPVGRERHEKVMAAVRHALGRLRHLLFQLHPPALETDGLTAAVEAYLSHLVDGTDLSFVVDDDLEDEPDAAIRALVYRLVQEAVTNVAKHAGARNVRVGLREQDGGILAEVEDDGEGFSIDEVESPRAGHMGLTAMRQRAEVAGGWWRVESEPRKGTTVTAWVPAPASREGVA